jgi:hypothetical protein
MSKSNSILLIDPSFDPATARNCKLLIKIGLDSLSYAIINKKTNKISAVFDEQECEDATRKLRERLKNDNYLQLDYQQVKVAIHTPNTIAVPNNLFNETDVAAHTTYFTAPHGENLYTKKQSYFDFTTIFALPKSTEQVLSTLKSENYPEHVGLLHLAEGAENNTLWVDFSAGAMAVVYVRSEQLIFQQTFEASNTEELNYYLLLLIKQLEINPDQTHVRLTGIIHENDEHYACFQKYFNDIQFSAVRTNLDQEILEDLPSHYYSNLLALDQCV